MKTTHELPNMAQSNRNGPEDIVHTYPFWSPCSARFRLTIILMVAVMANTFVRNTLSMAMVCMVNSTALHASSSSNHTNLSSSSNGGCVVSEETHSAAYDGPLLWNSNEQGMLFAAMYWGGVISGLPAGYLADRFNPKIVISICLMINLIGCLLSPITAVSGGLVSLFVLRVFMGLGGQATIYPSVTAITARWIPPTDRSKVIALYTAGSQVASIIGSPLNGFLCSQKTFMGGWPSIYYITGIVTVPSLFLWWFAITNSPDETRFINQKEKTYIKWALQKQNVNKRNITLKEVPWKKMLTSMPVMVTIIGNFTLAAMNTTLTSYIPTYFKESLKFDLSSNAGLGALPFISQWVGKILFSSIADMLKSRTKLSHTWICKIFQSIGSFGVAGFLIACACMDCSHAALAVAFVTIANGLFSCQVPGFLTSLVCIAPLYSGMVNAMSRFVGQIGSVVAPYVVGAITVNGTSDEWRLVFIIIAVSMCVTGILFLIFGSADIQEWAKSMAQISSPQVAVLEIADQSHQGISNRDLKSDQHSDSGCYDEGNVDDTFVYRV